MWRAALRAPWIQAVGRGRCSMSAPSPGPSPVPGEGNPEPEPARTSLGISLSQRALGEGGRAQPGREGVACQMTTTATKWLSGCWLELVENLRLGSGS